MEMVWPLCEQTAHQNNKYLSAPERLLAKEHEEYTQILQVVVGTQF